MLKPLNETVERGFVRAEVYYTPRTAGTLPIASLKLRHDYQEL